MKILQFILESLFKILDRLIEWYGKKNEWLVLDTKGNVIGKFKEKRKE